MAAPLSSSVPRAAVIAMTAALLALGYGCTRSRPAKEGAAPTVVRTTEAVKIGSPDAIPAAARGMWVWSTKSRLDDPNGTAKLLDTCRIAGLNEVYLSVNNGVLDDPRLVTLMTALRAAGVRVEALMGDAVWYQPDKRAPMLALVEAVAAYDEKHEAARFAGVHLDIEPHQLPANRGDHSFLPALAETIKEATELATRKNLSASADLPRFALDEAGPELARTGARPFVMLYQLREKTPAWLVTQSGKVIDHSYAGVGNEVPGGVVVGLRVEDYPTDLESMLTALQGAHGDRSRYRGWAIHDEAKYRARPRP